MKTRLFYVLLFISSITFAQKWTQVGNVQFSNPATDVVKIGFNSNNGELYLLYKNSNDSKMYVMKYNGTSWSNVGSSPSTASITYNNYAINVNPVTNKPWVVLKRTQNGGGHDIKRFDGTNWVNEGVNVATNTYSNPTQIHFDNNGTPRFSIARATGHPSRKLHFVTKLSSGWTEHESGGGDLNYHYDFTSFNEFFWVAGGRNALKATISITGAGREIFHKVYNGTGFRGASGIAGTNYYVAYNSTATSGNTSSGEIMFANGTTGLSQPTNAVADGHRYLKFRKSTADNNLYLMYKNSSKAITLQTYYLTSRSWSNISDPSINGSASNFIVDMNVNPITGDIYIAYLDNNKISVKKYTVPQPVPRYYVNANVSGGDGSGDSWANAIPNLQTALQSITTSPGTTEIWVAKGTYKPGTTRTNTFTVSKKNLSIYGGFTGTEANLSDRDISKIHTDNATILSGDLNDNDDANITYNNNTRTDNSLRIVQVSANNIVIDGVTIANGYADATSGEGRYGAGLKTANSVQNFTIKNSIIKNNVAWWGAGLSLLSGVNNSNMTIDACIFENNLASSSVSFYTLPSANKTMNVTVTNSLFKHNTSRNNGTSRVASGSSAGWIRAAYRNSTINATVVNNTFANNENGGSASSSDFATLGISQVRRGGTLGTLNIANNIFWGNTRSNGSRALAIGKITESISTSMKIFNSIDNDNFSNIANSNKSNTSNSNPNFTSATDFTLQAGSPAINAGDNSKIPSGITTDLAGNDRIKNTTVDIGAYEYSANPCTNIVNIPDTNFKNALLAHGATAPVNGVQPITGTGINVIDTDGDGEICVTEAQAYTGIINVSFKNISNLTGIEAFTALTQLFCVNNSLSSLNVSNNTALTRLECYDNSLSSLDVSNNTALTQLDCNSNSLSSLDLSNNTALTQLDCHNNSLSSLDVSNSTALTQLSCHYNSLSSLDVSNSTALTKFYCFNNSLSSLDLSNNTALALLDCNNNSLTSLNVANGNNGAAAPKLHLVYAQNNANLTCIQHDTGFDPTTATNWRKDTTASWSDNCAPASINDETFNNAVKMYPNPVQSTLYISASQTDIATITVFNVLGKQVLQSNQTNVNVSGLANGMYIVKIQSVDDKIATKKFVKQ